MRIDSHQHFWRYDPEGYSWIGEGMQVLARDFGPSDLEPHLAAFGMDGCVAVQASQTLEETYALLAHAHEHPFIKGVVGWADLRTGGVADQLGAAARDPKLVGLRHVVQDEPDDEFLLREDFCMGVAELADLGLTYDILIYPRQLPAAIRFVERFPEQPFVLDHMAKPRVRKAELEPWASGLRALARHPNITCKVSGLVTEADWHGWSPEDFLPYLDVALDAFGEDRLMFGSDWPVCLLAARYPATTAIVEGWAERLSPGARDKLFGENAEHLYGLVED